MKLSELEKLNSLRTRRRKSKATGRIRKPRSFNSWWVDKDAPVICHGTSGRLFYGIDHIRNLGNWMLACADWLDQRADTRLNSRGKR